MIRAAQIKILMPTVLLPFLMLLSVGSRPATAGDLLGSTEVRIDNSVIHAATVQLLGFSLQDVSCEPRMEGRNLTLQRITAQTAGGRIGGQVAIDLNTNTYQGAVNATGVSLARILRASQAITDGVDGRVSASFAFLVNADHPTALLGRGRITVTNATLIRMPMLISFFLTKGSISKRTGRDSAVIDVEVKDGRIQVTNAVISLPDGYSKIALRGTIGLDGQLNLAVATRFRGGVIDYIPGIGPVAIWFTAKLARWSIRGHISHPELRLNPFGDDNDL